MARTPKRLAGPAQVSNSAADKYTTPAATTTIVRQIILNNPGSAATFTLSVGADAAGVRIFDAVSIPDTRTTGPMIYNVYLVLAATEKIQAFSGTNNQIVLEISGDEIA